MEEKVIKCAKEVSLRHTTKPQHAIICYHGYTGYPGELMLPARILYESGFDVFIPRYPGHGTSGEDFMKSTSTDWVNKAIEAYREIEGEYDTIGLIGHSMGGLIALKVAYEVKHIHKIVLYAPALILERPIPTLLVSILSLCKKRKKVSWSSDPLYPFFDERDEGDDEYLGKEYWSYIYYKQVLELEKLRKEVLSFLGEIPIHTLVFTGGLDKTVSPQSGTLVEKGMKREDNKWIDLPLATHLIPYDKDESSRNLAMQETLLFLSP